MSMMSAVGHKQTSRRRLGHVRFCPRKRTLNAAASHVRFVPLAVIGRRSYRHLIGGLRPSPPAQEGRTPQGPHPRRHQPPTTAETCAPPPSTGSLRPLSPPSLVPQTPPHPGRLETHHTPP